MKYEIKSAYITFSKVLDLFEKYPESELKFARGGWNGNCMYISLQIPDENSKMTRPYLYLKTAQDTIVPWCPSQTDLLMDDWIQLPQDFYPPFNLFFLVYLFNPPLIFLIFEYGYEGNHFYLLKYIIFR